ncbi:MAG TPA: TCR/Tet family MFS transporter [Candidatus Eisenbacteria bacterium]|nr:TCR/Tet family MFS transporter [Candidatus Eisenbacteria bacterium]
MTNRVPGRNALYFIGITVLLDTIGFSLIAPILPRLLVELTGRSVSQSAVFGGWLSFVYAIMQFVCAPILGGLSDRFGRRPVLLYSVASLGVDYLIMGFAPTLGWLFLGRAISGIAGASFTPAYAYVADISAPEKRAQSFGLISASFGIGFIIGPGLGGLLSGFGVRAPFFAAATLSLLNFIYGFFVLPESLPRERRRAFNPRRANPLGTLFHMWKRPAVRNVLGAFFFWMVANQVMPSTWSFYTKLKFGWSEALIGASFTCAGVVMAASQALLMRRLVPRIGERRSALLGIASASLGYIGFGLATQGWMMFAWLVTWLFGALVMPSTNALLTHRVPPDAQGELQGAVACLISLASITGPVLMTQIFGYFTSPSAPVYLPGASFLFSATLAMTCWFAYRAATRESAVETGQALQGTAA